MDNCSEVDGRSFDGQLQRSVGKADSGMEPTSAKVPPLPGRRGGKEGHGASARGAYLRAAEYFRQGVLFGRDDLNGCELRSSCRAGWTRCCRARQCERVEQAEADPNDRRYTGRITAGGSGGPKC